jgi:hypothetical protein
MLCSPIICFEVKRIIFLTNKNFPKHKLFSENNGILLPRFFWPTVRKNCSSYWEKLSKFKDEGREFAKFLRSQEQFVRTVKEQNKFLVTECFLTCSWRFLRSSKLKQKLEFKLEKKYYLGFRNMQEKLEKNWWS